MAERIHDGEPDTTEAVVRTLLSRQCPEWASLPLSSLWTSGSDNAMWRLHVPDDHDLVGTTAAPGQRRSGHRPRARDLAPAWALFDKRGRDVFRDAVEVDEATWLRGRAFELEHALGGVLYYSPRHHPLGDLMARTLTRILEDT